MSEPASPSPGSTARGVGPRLRPRIDVSGERLVVRYAVAVTVGWLVLALAGLIYGFLAVGSGGHAGSGFAGLGLAVICGFVAWFAVRPIVVADRTGIAVLPVFGTRTGFRWSEINGLGVGVARRGRTRGPALTIHASDDREVTVDAEWLGLTSAALTLVDGSIRTFARSIGVVGPAADEPVVIVDEDARYH